MEKVLIRAMTVDNERALIINGQSSAKNNGTGFTLRSIISLIDKRNVLELFVDDGFAGDVNYESCSVCCDDCFLFSRASHKFLAGRINGSLKKVASSTPSDSGNKNLKSSIRRLGIYALDCLPMHISRRIDSLIESFRPTVIYTMAGSVRAMRLVIAISKKYSLPVVVHYMDDWPHESFVENSIVASMYWKQLRHMNRAMLAQTKHILAISPLMAKEYSKEYCIPASFIGCPTERTFFNLSNNEDSDHVSAIYAGGMHLGRWKSLSLIGNELKAFGERNDLPVSFDVYSPKKDIEEYGDCFDSYVSMHEAIPHEQIPGALRNHNLLIHAESLDKDSHSFYARLSVSTKIAEYLASGIRILFLGPKGSALSDMLATNGLAYIAGNASDLPETFELIKSDLNKRNQSIQENAASYAFRHYSIEASEEVLSSVFLDLRN
ncbi:MAG: hypothetical protein RR603_03060 [Kurthia sp.]